MKNRSTLPDLNVDGLLKELGKVRLGIQSYMEREEYERIVPYFVRERNILALLRRRPSGEKADYIHWLNRQIHDSKMDNLDAWIIKSYEYERNILRALF